MYTYIANWIVFIGFHEIYLQTSLYLWSCKDVVHSLSTPLTTCLDQITIMRSKSLKPQICSQVLHISPPSLSATLELTEQSKGLLIQNLVSDRIAIFVDVIWW